MKNDILIAVEKARNDGSKKIRDVQGCWGTKVDRLIADILNIIELGERCIVFSQWDEMIHIIGCALNANSIAFESPKGTKSFGDCVRKFRSGKCFVLVMNVKSGGEGLTLVEATHVFMVEPLLHHGLDMQAISRVHRIGQTRKTYVHRYIIQDTIEVKIDCVRLERQENNNNDSDLIVCQPEICAGGIDGGFNAKDLQEFLK
eukprot:CAMPEP_0171302488 /NCGR_PEP_ID=MMETSP0816-20121228/11878_1 /TAXON_ID=420281 /ORGANISM="Proboscia inermis, Strain CCAP1064/1" /LENGTH=201 /DNA_ID=CAMNT_0011780989 /DNA_START=34 /DNA_END=639 /DNA_ORIENTATION=-